MQYFSFRSGTPPRKRKRESTAAESGENFVPKKKNAASSSDGKTSATIVSTDYSSYNCYHFELKSFMLYELSFNCCFWTLLHRVIAKRIVAWCVPQSDNYCWECHKAGMFICCETCPRVFHIKCAGVKMAPPSDWACGPCVEATKADALSNRCVWCAQCV